MCILSIDHYYLDSMWWIILILNSTMQAEKMSSHKYQR